MNDREIARAVAAGSLRRVRHGAYVVGTTWSACDAVGQHALQRSGRVPAGQDRDRRLARERRGRMGHRTVGCFHSIRCTSPGMTSEQVGTRRVCTSTSAHLSRDGHRAPQWDPDHRSLRVRVSTRSPWLTSSTVWRSSNDAPPNRRAVTVDELWRSARPSWSNGPAACGTGSCFVLQTAESSPSAESRFFYFCWKQGLPSPIPQYEVHDDNGRLVCGRRLRLAGGSDCSASSSTARIPQYRAPDRDGETVVDVVLREKRREELVSRITGWRCLRVVSGRTSTSRRIPLPSCGACSGRRPWPTERTPRRPHFCREFGASAPKHRCRSAEVTG